MAVQSGLPMEGIRVLVQGGAHLDFRNRDGLTALHKAVWAHSHAGLLVRSSPQDKSTQLESDNGSHVGFFCVEQP